MAEVELTGMDGLAERLVQHHEQNGGWDAARANPGFWRDMVRPGAGMGRGFPAGEPGPRPPMPMPMPMPEPRDRKSTRLNSSHLVISYAVFCLKKKEHAHNFT